MPGVPEGRNLLAINHALKDFLSVAPIIKISALKLLPHLYSGDVKDIMLSTITKVGFEKGLMLKRASLLALYKFYIISKADELKPVLLQFLEAHFSAPGFVRGLALSLYAEVALKDCENQNRLPLDKHWTSFVQGLSSIPGEDKYPVLKILLSYAFVNFEKESQEFKMANELAAANGKAPNLLLVIQSVEWFVSTKDSATADEVILQLLKLLLKDDIHLLIGLNFLKDLVKRFASKSLVLKFRIFFFAKTESEAIKKLKLKILVGLATQEIYHHIKHEILLDYNSQSSKLQKTSAKAFATLVARFDNQSEEELLQLFTFFGTSLHADQVLLWFGEELLKLDLKDLPSFISFIYCIKKFSTTTRTETKIVVLGLMSKCFPQITAFIINSLRQLYESTRENFLETALVVDFNLSLVVQTRSREEKGLWQLYCESLNEWLDYGFSKMQGFFTLTHAGSILADPFKDFYPIQTAGGSEPEQIFEHFKNHFKNLAGLEITNHPEQVLSNEFYTDSDYIFYKKKEKRLLAHENRHSLKLAPNRKDEEKTSLMNTHKEQPLLDSSKIKNEESLFLGVNCSFPSEIDKEGLEISLSDHLEYLDVSANQYLNAFLEDFPK